MLNNGWWRFQPEKTKTTTGDELQLPLLPQLAAELSYAKHNHSTFLVTDFGRPFTSNGFGNKFKRWCVEAELTHCSAHGLRKAGATFAAENGATESQLRAMYGWRSAKMASHYTGKAAQKKLAAAGMPLIAANEY
jgi:integrase